MAANRDRRLPVTIDRNDERCPRRGAERIAGDEFSGTLPMTCCVDIVTILSRHRASLRVAVIRGRRKVYS